MAKELKDWIDEFVKNGANPRNVPDWPKNAGDEAETTLEITSEDITIEGNTIVFNSNVAQEIMSMNKRLKVDASLIDQTVAQGQLIGIFTPRAITDYSSIQEGITIYEYSTTNLLLDVYRTTYVEFIWDETNDKLYVDANRPTINEDHIVGFSTESAGGIRLTTNPDFHTSSINTLRINDLDTVSISDMPSLLFNANANNELESIEFMQNGYSSDFTYTIPKGAKHYVVNELPTTDIDTTGNYYVMTESEDTRGYLSTDIHNLTTTEYPPSTTGTLRQDATVNSSDWVKLNATTISSGDYMGDIAIKFNIPCTVIVSVNPRQTRLAFMYIDVNGVNVKLVNAGETYTYTRVFGVDETLCVRGASFSTNQFYYKLAIQPYTIDGKIPLSTNVDEYINYENLWFKNSGGTEVHLYEHNINLWCTTKTIDINFSYLSTSETELTIDDILSIYNGKNVGCYGLYSFDGKIGYLNYFSPYNNTIEVHYIAVFNGTATITSETIAKNNFTITDTVRTIY